MIRCKDIAEMVGVSRQAVTAVLNNSRPNCVSPEKREENKGEAKRAKKAKAPKTQPAAEVEEETEIAVETVEEIKPVEQSNDWLRAVEEALNAAQNKQ